MRMKISTLMVLALGSLVLAPFAMAASAPPTSGLLITHVNSQQWQIRLISGASMLRFSGVADSNHAITGVQTVRLESADSAKLLTANSLGATFTAWPGGSDGVNFTVSAGATLCLRDTGSTGVKYYLGDSMQDADPGERARGACRHRRLRDHDPAAATARGPPEISHRPLDRHGPGQRLPGVDGAGG